MLKDDGKWSIVEGIIAIQFIVIALKVIGLTDISWFWALTPIWLSGIILLIILVVGLSFLGKVVDFIKSKI